MSSPILDLQPLGFPWHTADPFLFCVHHVDLYPRGNDRLGPVGSLAGRDLGQDFVVKDGFRMYHGRVVPGFPQHPHRGFETVTIARRGLIDHSDSLGAAARFGEGDVQWLTAGAGIVHSEMFPLLRTDADNPAELFQIWLNLPSNRKMATPHFTMMWSETIPRVEVVDAAGRRATVTVVAGTFGDQAAPPPPPESWASTEGADVAIWCLHLEPGAQLTLPAAGPKTTRTLYFFAGDTLHVGGVSVPAQRAARVTTSAPLTLEAGREAASVLVLQGRPIGEPVVQYGPFVMNTRSEIQQAFEDYRRTEFGGWPWPEDGPVHPRDEGRFARLPTGETSRPPTS